MAAISCEIIFLHVVWIHHNYLVESIIRIRLKALCIFLCIYVYTYFLSAVLAYLGFLLYVYFYISLLLLRVCNATYDFLIIQIWFSFLKFFAFPYYFCGCCMRSLLTELSFFFLTIFGFFFCFLINRTCTYLFFVYFLNNIFIYIL